MKRKPANRWPIVWERVRDVENAVIALQQELGRLQADWIAAPLPIKPKPKRRKVIMAKGTQ